MTHSSNTIQGGYVFHAPQRDAGAPPRLSGAKSHIFQPPRTPPASASSSLILSHSTTSIISTTTSIVNSTGQNGTRKRRLTDYHEVETPEMSRMADDWERDQYGGRPEDWMPGSPKPFVDTRYHLAGGMDTPGMMASRADDVTYGEPMFRKSLSDMDEEKYNASLRVGADHSHASALEREANGRGRGQPIQQAGGWSKGAISVVGAVVGKAWEFCKAGATVFTGFRAGGGQAYKINEFDSVARFEAIENNWESEKPDYGRERRGHTPLPGGFPEEEFIYDYFSDHQAINDTPQRPTKRRQVSGGFRDEEIAKNWVVVPTPPVPKSQPRDVPPPQRPIHGFTPRRSMLPTSRPASRASLASAPNRRSLVPRGSHAGSPSLNPNRGASFAPSRTPTSKIPRATGSPAREIRGTLEESPVAREAKRWKAQRRKEEREADESIRRLDAQLKAMIREGKEALGTKVEVVDDDMDDEGDQTPRWAYS